MVNIFYQFNRFRIIYLQKLLRKFQANYTKKAVAIATAS
ncbi:hypothetical protein VCRA2119O381_1890004 [Vibrio crassostreae]|nr:hypothetical protein VCRA2119O381_1890004 [Vibrio crassostreae]